MHYKYSAMLNTTFITMMFGAGIPILFPIAGATFMVLYMLENYKFYWTYKQPPAYDEKLNTFCLSSLEKAPLFLLGFGYWMLSNHQLIQRKTMSCEPTFEEGVEVDANHIPTTCALTALMKSTDPFLAEHYWYEVFTRKGMLEAGPAAELLLCFCLYFLFIVAKGPISYIMGCCCKWAMLEEMEIDEDIDSYPNCLDDDDKDWTIQEELNMRNCYGIKTITDESVERIYNGHLRSPEMHL